ncbi:GIY-YIG nuclease family protein [Streptomyces avidinii]|uniref:GIY-YIG nuclease family protein n=1 Tax=Streptomyces avidinii TaxID=1895 RepID=UPI003798F6B0
MAQTFVLNINVAGTRIEDISLTTGMIMGSDARNAAPGHHMSVDVPAVMEILRSISSGAFTADEVHARLSRCVATIAKQLNDKHEEMVWLMEDAPSPRRKVHPKDRRPVYAVSSEQEPKIIKIGVTRNVAARLRSLQTASGSKLVVRWTSHDRDGHRGEHQPGGEPLERGLHEVFGVRRMSGEWFDFRDVADPVPMIEQAAYDLLDSWVYWEDIEEYG